MSGKEPPTPDEIAAYEARLAEYNALLGNPRLDRALEWIASLVFAGVVLAVWLTFDSLTLGFLAAIPLTALMVWGLFVLRRRRLRPSHEWLNANAHRFQKQRD